MKHNKIINEEFGLEEKN